MHKRYLLRFWPLAGLLCLVLGLAAGQLVAQCTGEVLNISQATHSTSGATGSWTVPAGGPYTVVVSGKNVADAGLFSLKVETTNTIWHVKPAGNDSNNGFTWGTAFQTLQQALAVADSGDEIWVAAGTYKPTAYPSGCSGCSTNRDFTFHLKDGVKLYGGFAGTEALLSLRNITTNPTILSGDFSGNDVVTGSGSTLSITGNGENAYHVVLSVSDAATTILDGFTISGGNANNPNNPITVESQTISQTRGGGMANFSSSPSITNTNFTGNSAIDGGGMANAFSSSPSITNTNFTSNSAASQGGGMFNTFSSSPSITNTTFTGNWASFGGGMSNSSSSPSITNTNFTGNSAIDGGGMYNTSSSSPTITNTTFTNNSATRPANAVGGAMYNRNAFATITNTTFTGNSATGLGGGIYVGGDLATGTLAITNSIFNGNSATSGGAIAYDDKPAPYTVALASCTFYNNTASGSGGVFFIRSWSTGRIPPVFDNCILWNNSSSVGVSSQGAFEFKNSLIQEATCPSNATCTNVLNNQDPLFVNAANPAGPDGIYRTADDGLRLQAGSPAINAGDNSLIPSGITTDIMGAARIQGGTVDLGAYEGEVCPTLTTAAPPAVVSSQSTCTTGCTLSGGVISAPSTACPTGSTLQYSTNGGSNWSTMLPTYNQTSAVTVLTRCNCNTDANISSPTSSVTTVPGTCTPPAAPIISNSNGLALNCNNPGTMLSVAAPGNYTWTLNGDPAGSGPSVNAVVAGTYQVTNTTANGCTSSATVLVTFTPDNTPPSITCPPPVTVSCASAVPAVSLASVTATDNCGAPTKSFVGNALSNPTCLNRFTVTRTYRAIDGSNNSATCSQIITVNDVTLPTFNNPPANITVQCNAVPNVATGVTAADNCGGAVNVAYQGQTRADGNCPGRYTLSRRWTATDGCGNVRTHTQIITVTDTQAPIFTSIPANVTVQCSAVPSVAAPSAVDNCGAVTITYNGETRTDGSCPDSYTLIRRWTATDLCSNMRTASQRITVVDTQAPTLVNVPGNLTLSCSDPLPEVGTPTGQDNCDNSVAIDYLGQTTGSASCANSYLVQRRWKATDNCGNFTISTQTITVQDTQAPTFSFVPADLTQECSTPLPFPGTATATDNCGGFVQVLFQGEFRTDGNCLYNYTITRSWRAVDQCGNSATASQLITVQDTQSPTFQNAPANVTVSCGNIPNPPAVVGQDNCGPAAVTYQGQSQSPGDCQSGYTISRTWTATDLCSNSSTYTQTITVQGQSLGNGGEERSMEEIGGERLPSTVHRPPFAVRLMPNPAFDVVQVRYELAQAAEAVITVSDLSGRVVHTRTYLAEAGENVYQLELETLAGGVYLVQVRSGGQRAVEKLIVLEK